MGRYHCGHCNQAVSKTAFHQHKRLYYDCLSKKWSSTRVNYSELEADGISGPSSIPFSNSSSESENDDLETPTESQEFSPGVCTPFSEGKSIQVYSGRH